MVLALSGVSPAGVFSDTAANTALTTASFTPPSGSVIVVKVTSADASQTHSTPTATGLTFTSRNNVGNPNSTTRVSQWTAIGAGSAITVSANYAGTVQPRGISVEVWTGAQLAASPAVHTIGGTTTTGAPSDSITTVAAGSVVSWVSADWAAVAGARTYRSSATEQAYHTLTGFWTHYGAYQSAASAGAQTYGMTAPTGQTYTMASIEIQDSGGVTPTPPELVMAFRAF